MSIQRSANWPFDTPGGQESANLLYGFQADVVVDAGKCLADVEGFSVPIEVAMVIGGESGIRSQFAGEQAARQRHASENANRFFLARVKKMLGGPLPETIEDDLHGLHVGILDSPSASSTFSTLTP